MYETAKGTGYMAAVIPESADDEPKAFSVVRQGDRFWKIVAVERPYGWQPSTERHLLLRPMKGTEGMPAAGRLLKAHGCCMDRRYGKGCADDTCMSLPTGKVCADCVHVKTCVAVFGHNAEWIHCQWFPRRFHEVEK
jgi:hypothetical protein